MNNIKIFSGTSKCTLAEKVAKKLEIPMGEAKILKFADGECYVKINEKVRGEDVFIIQSTSHPVNENIIDLLIFIDALKRASAKSINLVIPYFGYARQDRKAAPRAPITAKLIANLITTAGADRIITLDLHTAQLEGFFDIPVDNLGGLPIIANKLKEEGIKGEDLVVIAPHTNAVKMARKLSEKLDSKLAIIDRRNYDGEELRTLIGDVSNKRVVIMDDMITSGETLLTATKVVKEEGAKEIYACSIHGVFTGDALNEIEESQIEKLFITDSVPLDKSKNIKKIEVLSSDFLFSEALKRIMTNKSLRNIIK